MNATLRAGALLTVVISLWACSGRQRTAGDGTDEPPAAPELPEVASIAGVQDVWPFVFGFDATREDVERALGVAQSMTSRNAGESDATVVTWNYPAVDFVFYLAPSTQSEFILSARIRDETVSLGAGIGIGMPADRAAHILGDPGHRTNDTLVYFYYSTTIELVIRDDLVREIVIARSLP
jgi:hypothetical protein